MADHTLRGVHLFGGAVAASAGTACQRPQDSAVTRPVVTPGRRLVDRHGLHAGAWLPLVVPADPVVIQVLDRAMFAGPPLTPCSSSAATRGCARSSSTLLPPTSSPVVWRGAARQLGPRSCLVPRSHRLVFSQPHLAPLSFSFVAAGSWYQRAMASRGVGVETSERGQAASEAAASRSLDYRGREGSGGSGRPRPPAWLRSRQRASRPARPGCGPSAIPWRLPCRICGICILRPPGEFGLGHGAR